MPELPDITIYIEAFEKVIGQEPIQGIELRSPFLLRSVEPGISETNGKQVVGFRRIGKRIVWELEDDIFMIFHLMVSGRFHWKPPGTKSGGKNHLASFHFPKGTVTLTEASSKKRASLHIVRGEKQLEAHDPKGLEVLDCDLPVFKDRLLSENHTLKRALTDPTLFSGIGNAFSDEILFEAGLSPITWTSRLRDDEIERLFAFTCSVLSHWVEQLREVTGDSFPEKVTAFRKQMYVHGRFGKPCKSCETTIQRVVYSSSETNYCPRCQTGGKVLADRSLSRLFKKDWPRSIEELELRKGFGAQKTS
jgi:formamidopyrimidine-DNA glycosylase